MNHSLKEFDEFKGSDGIAPSTSVTQAVFAQVHRDLNPSAWKIFGKLSLIHCCVGAVTLSICPQFGIRILGNGMGLMTQFMRFGDYGCSVACGSFFMGMSVLVATFLLRSEEIKVLKQNQLLEFGALTLLSIGAFLMFHAEILVGFAVAWFLGTILGGSFTFEIARLIRKRLVRFSS